MFSIAEFCSKQFFNISPLNYTTQLFHAWNIWSPQKNEKKKFEHSTRVTIFKIRLNSIWDFIMLHIILRIWKHGKQTFVFVYTTEKTFRNDTCF